MLTFISFIFVFGLLVFFHEFGHFSLAKLNGIKVHEFALGMGPKLLKYKSKETEYSIRILPIGGFVKMEGEDEDSKEEGSFSTKSPLQRISVIAAGPLMNILLAIILFFVIAINIGLPVNVISQVTEDSPADLAGLKPGDKIVRVNNNKIENWDQLVQSISQSNTEDLEIVTVRNNDEQTIIIKPIIDEQTNNRIIGIAPQFDKSFKSAMEFSTQRVAAIAKGITGFLVSLIKGKASAGEVVGPIGMVHFVGEAAKISIYSLLSLAAIISVNLAIINILPFPALDGGRLIFILIELVKGSPIDPEKEGFVHFVGFVVLLALMVFVIYKDIMRFNIF